MKNKENFQQEEQKMGVNLGKIALFLIGGAVVTRFLFNGNGNNTQFKTDQLLTFIKEAQYYSKYTNGEQRRKQDEAVLLNLTASEIDTIYEHNFHYRSINNQNPIPATFMAKLNAISRKYPDFTLTDLNFR